MAEFAFSPYETLSSIQGHTKNPYALDRVPAGSSGGTAASVAASFATVGLGSDTGNSIRGPSAHTALVGIRSTMGLTSRAGVIPLSYLADVAGPMARTMEDAVAVFQVIVGEDPEDPVDRAQPRPRDSRLPRGAAYATASRARASASCARRTSAPNQPPDEEVVKVFTKALDDMKARGRRRSSTSITIERVQRPQSAGTCRGFKYDINDYLATRGQKAPVHSLEEIIASGKFDPSVQARLHPGAARESGQGPESDACKAEAAYREAFGAAITKAMDEQRLDALVYPTWSYPAAADRRLAHRRAATTARCIRRRRASPPSPCRWATRATGSCRPASRSSAARGTKRASSNSATATSRQRSTAAPPASTPPIGK